MGCPVHLEMFRTFFFSTFFIFLALGIFNPLVSPPLMACGKIFSLLLFCFCTFLCHEIIVRSLLGGCQVVCGGFCRCNVGVQLWYTRLPAVPPGSQIFAFPMTAAETTGSRAYFTFQTPASHADSFSPEIIHDGADSTFYYLHVHTFLMI